MFLQVGGGDYKILKFSKIQKRLHSSAFLWPKNQNVYPVCKNISKKDSKDCFKLWHFFTLNVQPGELFECIPENQKTLI